MFAIRSDIDSGTQVWRQGRFARYAKTSAKGGAMEASYGNLYKNLPAQQSEEAFFDLVTAPGLRIERIVSTGQVTPLGTWLDQDRAEWVILLQGAAGLWFEVEASVREMKPGDYVAIPAHARHRVEWTSPNEPTVWLAVHYAT
jgi:cupin 2 domain-containing protein